MSETEARELLRSVWFICSRPSDVVRIQDALIALGESVWDGGIRSGILSVRYIHVRGQWRESIIIEDGVMYSPYATGLLKGEEE